MEKMEGDKEANKRVWKLNLAFHFSDIDAYALSPVDRRVVMATMAVIVVARPRGYKTFFHAQLS